MEICFVYNFLSLAVDNSHRRATSITIAKMSAFEKKKTKRESEKRIRKERKKNNVTAPVKSTVKANPARFYTATSKTTDTFEDLVQVLESQ